MLVTCQQVRNIKFLPTPSARRATLDPNKATHTTEFLPTPSARRATHNPVRDAKIPKHFYPRPPRGGRLDYLIDQAVTYAFLPTPSARRATQQGC